MHSSESLANPNLQAVAFQEVALVPMKGASELPPVFDKDGNQHSVVAWLDIPAESFVRTDFSLGFTTIPREPLQSTRVAVCKDSPKADSFTLLEFRDGVQTAERTAPAKPDKFGETLRPDKTDFNYQLAVIQKAKGVDGPALAIQFGKGVGAYDNNPTIDTGANPVTKTQGYIHQLIKSGNKLSRVVERTTKVVKAAIGAVAVYSIFASGGVTDHALEGFNNAKSSVEHRLDNYENRAQWMRLGENTKPPTPEEYKQEVGRVAQTMDDLDGHNSEAIATRAEQFRQHFRNELMSETQVKTYLHELESAKSQDQALSVLNKFMSFYGKKAEFLQEDFVEKTPHGDGGFYKFDPNVHTTEQVAWLAGQFIKTFSYLPKSMVENGRFNTVQIGGDPVDIHSPGVYRGDGSKDERVLTFGVQNFMNNLKKAGNNAVPDALHDPSDISFTIFHEFGHSYDADLQKFSGTEPNSSLSEQFWGQVLQMPPQQTIHAAAETSGEAERHADNFGAALDINSDRGLSHPDQLRAFVSGANTSRLKIFAGLEHRYPGITDHIASLRLNQRSAFATPLIPFL